MRMPNGIKWCIVAAAMALSSSIAMGQQKVNDKALVNAPKNGDEWLTNGRDYSEERYSPLKQIDTNNVSRLGLAWYYDTVSFPGPLECTPIVSKGRLHVR